jgi:hypothetical protein
MMLAAHVRFTPESRHVRCNSSGETSSTNTMSVEKSMFASISGTDEMSIKYKRDKVGDYSHRYDDRRHKPLGHNSSSYELTASMALSITSNCASASV